MGKIRTVTLGDEKQEKAQAKKAEARREAKKFKKQKVEGVGLHGGERTAVVEGVEINPEFKKLIEHPEEEGKKKTSSRKQKIHSKRYQEALKQVDRAKLYPLSDAISLMKKTSVTKFDGTVEVHINLNPATLGGKNELRGVVNFPHSTGKKIRVAIVDDQVLSQIEAGKLDFDILIAHPSMMAKIARFARVLGPKGLMPNPKNGTVSDNPEKRAAELSGGQVNFKTEQNNPILHLSVGKVSHQDQDLQENIKALTNAVGKNKIANVTIASTMGPGIKLDVNGL